MEKYITAVLLTILLIFSEIDAETGGFESYGETSAFNLQQGSMVHWIERILVTPEFMQQMNPWTGEFSTSPGYTPCMCLFIDFVERLGLTNKSNIDLK